MVYHSQDPMCPSQSKKLCFFLWCMAGKFLKKVLPFPVTTFVLYYPQWYERWVTRMAQQYTVHDKGMGEVEGIGEWFVRFPSPLPLRPRFSTASPCCLLGGRIGDGGGVESKEEEEEEEEDHNWKRGGGRKGAPQNFCRCERKWKFSPSASTKP